MKNQRKMIHVQCFQSKTGSHLKSVLPGPVGDYQYAKYFILAESIFSKVKEDITYCKTSNISSP